MTRTRSGYRLKHIFSVIAIVAVAGSARPASEPYRRTALDGQSAGSDWRNYGGTHAEGHYSALSQISTANVGKLGLAWSLDLPGERTLEATPLYIDGALYFSGDNGSAYAVDARAGRIKWRFDPDVASRAPDDLRNSMGNDRGVAFWNGKIFVGSTDGRLFALDASSGKPVWQVDTFDGSDRPKSITGAPRVFNGKVVIGHGGAEMGARGYVTAYDTESGAKLWRFYTVPGDPAKGFENDAMKMAAKTWNGEWWRWGGGGTVWDSMTYDPELDRLYIGVGNGGPWNAQLRSPGGGDNLFLASIVALDAATGAYVWHYQMNPNETWDYKSTANMIMADVPIDGHVRKVLMQAPTNGFFYVLDRTNGQLISAAKIGKVTWASHIDMKTGRPVETPTARYQSAPRQIWPSAWGTHNWQPMAFSPTTGLVYIPTQKMGMLISASPNGPDVKRFQANPKSHFGVLGAMSINPSYVDPDDGVGGLLAWDPATQRKRWEVTYSDSFWNGGVMSTAGGLVFQGTARGQFSAFDGRTGAKLWSFDARHGIMGAPITYMLGGRQYVALLVGYGGSAGVGGKLFDYGWRYGEQPRRLLVFTLGGTTPLPPTAPPRFTVKALDDPKLAIDPRATKGGAVLFNMSCALCHGAAVEGTGPVAPDLRESAAALDYETFRSILHDGLLSSNGMPRYSDLDGDEIRSIYMYIRQRTRETIEKNKSPDGKPRLGGL